jgi:hypothetical protein
VDAIKKEDLTEEVIPDYSFAAHAPDPSFATKLDTMQMKAFMVPSGILRLFKKLGPLIVK